MQRARGLEERAREGAAQAAARPRAEGERAQLVAVVPRHTEAAQLLPQAVATESLELRDALILVLGQRRRVRLERAAEFRQEVRHRASGRIPRRRRRTTSDGQPGMKLLLQRGRKRVQPRNGVGDAPAREGGRPVSWRAHARGRRVLLLHRSVDVAGAHSRGRHLSAAWRVKKGPNPVPPRIRI